MVSTKKITKEKYTTVMQFLNDEFALLHVNPIYPKVSLPSHLQTNCSVTLKISRFFRGAMDVTETGITAELLFSGEYYTCVIPFEAVWGITSEKGENVIWPDSAPDEVLSDVFRELGEDRDELRMPVRESSMPPNMKSIPPQAMKPLPAKGHLRRVK